MLKLRENIILTEIFVKLVFSRLYTKCKIKFSIDYVIIKHTTQIKKKISTGHILVYLNEILYLVKSLTEILKHNYVIITQTVKKKKFFIKKKAENCQHDKQYRKKKLS